MRAKLVNEAIKHLSPHEDVVIDNDTFATITLYTNTGLFIKNKRFVLDRQSNNIYPKDFAWLGKDVKTLNQFINELKNFINSDIGAGNIYEIKVYKITNTIGKTLLFTIDNSNEQGYLDESIKHLEPRSNEDIESTMKDYGLYDRFFVAVAENLPDVLEGIISSKDQLTYNDIRIALLTASLRGNKEIVKILIDKFGASPYDVNLDYIDNSLIPLIKQYRKERKQKIKRK